MFSLITGVIAKFGVWGVFFLMLLENLIPLIPSELILPMAGFQAARGQFDPVSAVLLATAGSSIGGAAWYAIGRWVGLERFNALSERHGRWLPVSRSELERSRDWFMRWGAAAVFIGRTLPGVRGVICIPAGIIKMRFSRFLAWSTAGALIWSGALVTAGYVLHDHYASVSTLLNPVADTFLGLSLALYLFRVARYRH